MVAPLATLAAVVATLGSASAFFVNIHPIVTARMDPIINSGVVGSHVHQIYGANNFRSVLNTPTELLDADCTSASVGVDKSNYWAPHVYFINDDGKFEALASNGGRMYYHIRSPKTQPFPQGFRMVAGNAMNRDIYQETMAANQLGFMCDGKGPDHIRTHLPNATSFPEGCNNLMQTITFPSCGWANQTLDVDDHRSHVTFPIQSHGNAVAFAPFQGNKCPSSHPIKYPNNHLEVYYRLSERQKAQWANGKRINRLVLANGDLLGTTNHADFVMGWEPKAFAAAMTECNEDKLPGDGKADDCEVFKASALHINSRNCRFAGMIPDEDVGYGKALDRLPGCNPLWDRDGGDDKPTSCDGAANPGWVGPNALFQTNERYPIPVAIDVGNTPVNESTYPREAYSNEAYFEPYDDQTYCCGQVAPNLGKWYTSTPADIQANKDMATAPNKIDKVYNQKDSSTFQDRMPSGPVATVHEVDENAPTVAWTQNGIAYTSPPADYSGLKPVPTATGMPGARRRMMRVRD